MILIQVELRRDYRNLQVMSTYKLFYFNMRGFAEVNRIIFAQAGVKYEDVRFEWGRQWVKEYQQCKTRLIYLMALTVCTR